LRGGEGEKTKKKIKEEGGNGDEKGSGQPVRETEQEGGEERGGITFVKTAKNRLGVKTQEDNPAKKEEKKRKEPHVPPAGNSGSERREDAEKKKGSCVRKACKCRAKS